MIIEFLRFIFSNIWYFFGACIILTIAINGVVRIISSIAKVIVAIKMVKDGYLDSQKGGDEDD